MISAKRNSGLAAEITARKHSIIAGVSAALGGQDEGLNPHEILEGALAACTIITVQMYANRKGIKLESTDVVVKILEEGAETKISRKISLRGELSEDEKTRLMEIADKCPIHKLLESKVAIQTEIENT
jgi:putative redox protein